MKQNTTEIQVGSIICCERPLRPGEKGPVTVTGKVVETDRFGAVWLIADGELFCALADQCWWPKEGNREGV